MAIEEKMSHVQKIRFDWTSETDGTATETTSEIYNGEIIRLVTIPGAGGVAPTAAYDVVVNDEDDTDVLMGAGADRSNSAVEQVLAANLGIVANDRLSLSITNAGSGKSGTVIVYIR